MAKPNKRKSKYNRGKGTDTVQIIALLVFIAIGIGIVGGTVWYYAFFQPRAAESIVDITTALTQEYFNVTHLDITGSEGAQWMTPALAEKNASGDRVKAWQEREIVSRIEGDVQVQILEQGLRSARTRAIFWQYEEKDEKEGKDYLVYYDYALIYADGQWLVDEILTASEEGLKDLRKARGVYDQHYYEDEEDEEGEEEPEGAQDETESETQSGDQ
jgi:hypothetical protein